MWQNTHKTTVRGTTVNAERGTIYVNLVFANKRKPQATSLRATKKWTCLSIVPIRSACAEALAQECLHTGACISHALTYPSQAAEKGSQYWECNQRYLRRGARTGMLAHRCLHRSCVDTLTPGSRERVRNIGSAHISTPGSRDGLAILGVFPFSR